jgi:hypothetical protein
MEELVRERGTQSRRAKGNDADLADGPVDGPVDEMSGVPTSRATPRPPSRTPRATQGGGGPSRGAGYWPALAIIAIVVATAGWTTVAVMAINDGGPAAAASEDPIEDPDASFAEEDFSEEPVEDRHDAQDLEALLPTEIAGTPLSLQSWTGDTLLSDDAWSVAVAGFLTSVGKTPVDLAAAQAVDPTQAIDHSVGVFRLPGIPVEDLRSALVDAWKSDYPELVVSTITLDGMEVVKGDFGEDSIDSYWYEKDDLLFDVETSDESIATTVLAGIRDGERAPTAPSAPAGSAEPSGPAASPSPS